MRIDGMNLRQEPFRLDVDLVVVAEKRIVILPVGILIACAQRGFSAMMHSDGKVMGKFR